MKHNVLQIPCGYLREAYDSDMGPRTDHTCACIAGAES